MPILVLLLSQLAVWIRVQVYEGRTGFALYPKKG
jgi:hypothetical protein